MTQRATSHVERKAGQRVELILSDRNLDARFDCGLCSEQILLKNLRALILRETLAQSNLGAGVTSADGRNADDVVVGRQAHPFRTLDRGDSSDRD